MDDGQIVELYWQRDEAAIRETEEKYGALCRGIAQSILKSAQDAEECASDALLQAWNAIPPQRPQRLGAWLGRVTRNLALNAWRRDRAQKRQGGMAALLDELAECIPGPVTVDGERVDLTAGCAPCPRGTGCCLCAGTGTASPSRSWRGSGGRTRQGWPSGCSACGRG